LDGNDSLKRILQWFLVVDGDPTIPGPSCESTDTRKVTGDMYISRDNVDKWAHQVVAKVASEEVSLMLAFFTINIG
jgi:hypothetical protein